MNELHARRATDPPQRRRMRRGMYILPSLFTAANIAAGYYAITQALQGSAAEPHFFNRAAIAIGFAVLFDGLDGRIARMTNTTSDFGRELDSLADVITFGVAPALLAFTWGFHFLPDALDPMLHTRLIRLGGILTFLFLICGASRLARFNISTNPKPSNPGAPGRKYFVGMPIPAGAGVIAAFVHFFDGVPVTVTWVSIAWMCVIGLIGFLMVSTWRFWSGKELDLRSRHPFRVFILLGALGALIAEFHETVLFAMALLYMASGIFTRITYGMRRRGRVAREAGSVESSSGHLA